MASSIAPWVSIFPLLLFVSCCIAVSGVVESRGSYKVGDAVSVTCLNRTMYARYVLSANEQIAKLSWNGLLIDNRDTGEHITDSSGSLQFIPFPVCAETDKPLFLHYGSNAPQNCTITLDDPLFHLLEFYIHNDAPLTCRIPSFPTTGLTAASISGEDRAGALGSQSTSYTPLIFALSGTLQLSHLHVANKLNMAIHVEPKPSKGRGFSAGGTGPRTGDVISAAAYSTYPTTEQTKIVIGDSLTFQLYPRWYSGIALPSSTSGHHNFWSTLSYCALSALVSAAVCVVYFRGVDLPRRLRFHGRDRIGGSSRQDGLPKYSGYGYGVAGNGYTFNTGKRD